MSVEALRWVKNLHKTVGKIGKTPKAVLRELADWASADGRSYPLIPTIANIAEVDERTVIRALKRLEDLELIEHESWITPPGSDRHRPVYRLAMPDIPPFQPDPKLKKRGGVQPNAKTKGCQNVTLSATAIEGSTVSECHPLKRSKGDTGDTLKGDTLSPKTKDTNCSGDKSPSPRARASEALAEEILVAMPPEFVARTSLREVLSAIRSEAAKGADPERIVAGVLGYLGNRKAWGASGDPMAPHKLIASGRWESALRAATPKGSPVSRTGFAVPDDVRLAFFGKHGPGPTESYLRPCGWRASDRTLLATNGTAEAWLRRNGYRVERQSAAGKVG